jgi:hypothetical protein
MELEEREREIMGHEVGIKYKEIRKMEANLLDKKKEFLLLRGWEKYGGGYSSDGLHVYNLDAAIEIEVLKNR